MALGGKYAEPNVKGQLLRENAALRARVAELEAENRRRRTDLDACKSAVVQTIGGVVEGQPTHNGNYLQRLRELVAIERRWKRRRR